jgi:hypothetical protein
MRPIQKVPPNQQTENPHKHCAGSVRFSFPDNGEVCTAVATFMAPVINNYKPVCAVEAYDDS